MSLEQFDDYLEMVARASAAYDGELEVRLGLESDFIPGIEPFLEKLHARAPLEFILGSIHPQLPYYKDEYYTGDAEAFHRLYFEHLAQAAESGLYDCLSHPDLIKNTFTEAWQMSKYMDAMRRSLDRIAKTGIAMELNTSGLHKRVREMNPNPTMLREMQARDIPVVLGSDAHSPDRVAADFEDAMALLQEAGYETVTYFQARRPQQVSITEGLASLQAAKPVKLL